MQKYYYIPKEKLQEFNKLRNSEDGHFVNIAKEQITVDGGLTIIIKPLKYNDMAEKKDLKETFQEFEKSLIKILFEEEKEKKFFSYGIHAIEVDKKIFETINDYIHTRNHDSVLTEEEELIGISRDEWDEIAKRLLIRAYEDIFKGMVVDDN